MPKHRMHDHSSETLEGQRLDIWLYRTRFFKTRSLATKTVLKGKIRVTRNGQTLRTKKPGTLLRPGDKALFMKGEVLIHIEMLGPAKRRGPYSEAQTLYKILPLDVSQ